METLSWYVVHTKPRNEYRAERELSNQGYVTYLPELRRKSFVRGRERISEEPLFPGYLFIHVSIRTEHWASICSTRGVRRILSFGEAQPAAVPDEVVTRIRSSSNEREVVGRFLPGDRVSVVRREENSHKETELWGRISCLDGEERAHVLFSLLGRENVVNIGLNHLVPE